MQFTLLSLALVGLAVAAPIAHDPKTGIPNKPSEYGIKAPGNKFPVQGQKPPHVDKHGKISI